MKINKIVLVGYRGSGKTTVGKVLSTKFGLRFIDTDAEIEKSVGCSIFSFVKDRGWDAFREEEKRILKKVSKLSDVVVASGGGSFMDGTLISLFKRSQFFFIYLKASPPFLRGRMTGSGERPSLTGNHPLDEIEEVLLLRDPVYTSIADMIVSTDGLSPDEVVDQVDKGIKALLEFL